MSTHVVGAHGGAEHADVGGEHGGECGHPTQGHAVRLSLQGVAEANEDERVADAIYSE